MLESPAAKRLEQILRQHATSADDAVVEYLVEFLLQQQQDENDDDESVVATVAQFLDDDSATAAAIVAELRKQEVLLPAASDEVVLFSGEDDPPCDGASDPIATKSSRPQQETASSSSSDKKEQTRALSSLSPRFVSTGAEEMKKVETSDSVAYSGRFINAPAAADSSSDDPSSFSKTSMITSQTKVGQQQQQPKSGRKERRKQRAAGGGKYYHHKGKHTISTSTNNNNNNNDPDENDNENNENNSSSTGVEDQASAWGDCLATQQVWGGRGKGGRGAYAGRTNSVKANIHLTPVTIALPNGTELLHDATMDIQKGHRYGLVGRNGCGKSTLLQRLAQHAIPGLPHDLRVLLVEQQQQDIPTATTNTNVVSALDMLVQSDTYRTSLLREQERLEALLEGDDPCSTLNFDIKETDMVEAAEELGQLAVELDSIQADTAEERATAILRGLQFTPTMMHGPASNLSGGWRMRLALARALFLPHIDLILLDECTNHLDLHGLEWLIGALTNTSSSKGSEEKTLIVVSHDRAFLDAVCTDIIVLEHQRLSYHVGNYSMYEQQMQEKAARESQILDAAERQRSKAQAFVQKQQQAAQKKLADPNKQRQAKMIRDKKLDRIGNYREDGKRYKLRSLKALDEKSVRLAQKVQIEVDEPVIQMYFPNPVWPPAVGPHDAIVRLEDLNFGYPREEGNDKDEQQRFLLKDVTLTIDRGSKVALVGKNGCGKSTLVRQFLRPCVYNSMRCTYSLSQVLIHAFPASSRSN